MGLLQILIERDLDNCGLFTAIIENDKYTLTISPEDIEEFNFLMFDVGDAAGIELVDEWNGHTLYHCLHMPSCGYYISNNRKCYFISIRHKNSPNLLTL